MNRYSIERSVIFCLFAIMQIIFAFKVFAQDERLFRQMFTGELVKQKAKENYKVRVESKSHQIDINKDGIFESLIVAKKDGLDFFIIRDFEGKDLIEEKLDTYGKGSYLYKIEKMDLSIQTQVFILSFFDGMTEGKKFEGRARVYFLTIDNNDFQTLSLYRGPFYWQEIEKLREVYWQSPYSVSVIDLNKDGTREIMISHKSNQKLFFYEGKGKWRRI